MSALHARPFSSSFSTLNFPIYSHTNYFSLYVLIVHSTHPILLPRHYTPFLDNISYFIMVGSCGGSACHTMRGQLYEHIHSLPEDESRHWKWISGIQRAKSAVLHLTLTCRTWNGNEPRHISQERNRKIKMEIETGINWKRKKKKGIWMVRK